MSLLMRFASNEDPSSVASWMRRRRFQFFLSLLRSVPRPLRILDVGGSAAFWRQMGFDGEGGKIEVTILSPEPQPEDPDFRVVNGDAREMPDFGDAEFDVVHSNSVIEHVGAWQDQWRAAVEMRRVGQRHFVQTPNRYFPLEPHFLFPGFQFLPVAVRARLLSRSRLGWMPRAPDLEAARRTVERIRLLTHTELRRLFPNSSLHVERIAGLPKSFIAYGGW